MIGSLAVTVPSAWYLLQQSPDTHYLGPPSPHHIIHDEAQKEEEPKEEESKSDDSGSESGDETPKDTPESSDDEGEEKKDESEKEPEPESVKGKVSNYVKLLPDPYSPPSIYTLQPIQHIIPSPPIPLPLPNPPLFHQNSN